MAAGFDPTQLLATGGVGGFLVGMGYLFIRGSRNQSETFKETIKELRIDKKILKDERDAEILRANQAEEDAHEQRITNRRLSAKLTKEMLRHEIYLEEIEADISHFLTSKGIDPDLFILRKNIHGKPNLNIQNE